MEIKYIWKDLELLGLCRETLADIAEHQWNLSVMADNDLQGAADLYIWDFHPESSLPSQMDWTPTKNLFLVHRKDLDAFRKMTECAELHILLKPVIRSTLS